MKKIFNNSDLPHIFNSRKQETGRNSNRSFWFRNGVLHSYAVRIARFVDGCGPQKNQTILLMTLNHWSKTTARHVSECRSACSNRTIVYCQEVGAGEPESYCSDHEYNLQCYLITARENADKAMKAQKYHTHAMSQARSELIAFIEYVELFRLGKLLTDDSKTGNLKSAFRDIKKLFASVDMGNFPAHNSSFVDGVNSEKFAKLLNAILKIDYVKWCKKLQRAEHRKLAKHRQSEHRLRSFAFQSAEAKRIEIAKAKSKPNLTTEQKIELWRQEAGLTQFPRECCQGYELIKRLSDRELGTSKSTRVSIRQFKFLFDVLHQIRNRNLLGQVELCNAAIAELCKETVSGYHHVNRVDIETGNIHIGCHTFQYSELAAQYNQLGGFVSTDWTTETRRFIAHEQPELEACQ